MQCERDRTVFINEYTKSAKFTIPLGVIRSKKHSIIRYWCCKKSSFVCRIVEQFHRMKLMQSGFINEYTCIFGQIC